MTLMCIGSALLGKPDHHRSEHRFSASTSPNRYQKQWTMTLNLNKWHQFIVCKYALEIIIISQDDMPGQSVLKLYVQTM